MFVFALIAVIFSPFVEGLPISAFRAEKAENEIKGYRKAMMGISNDEASKYDYVD